MLRAAAVVLLAACMSALVTAIAAAETWLCPVCQTERIEREPNTPLTCPKCKITFAPSDLELPVAYLSVRTRPTEVVWALSPECGIFRNEGLLVFEPKQTHPTLWVPWSAMDYYIPRQRILRLTSGQEFLTPYAQSDDLCKEPPQLICTLADSTGDFLGRRSIRTLTKTEALSVVFLVARSPDAREAARDRFVKEVTTGKHPRLPRTNPTFHHIAVPMVPTSAANDSADVVLEVRVDELGQIMKVDRIQGSGNPEIDQAALIAARRSSIYPGGEMGAGVPSSAVITYHFRRGTVTSDGVPADPPMWREWLEPPSR